MLRITATYIGLIVSRTEKVRSNDVIGFLVEVPSDCLTIYKLKSK